jgi:hypothetical protein
MFKLPFGKSKPKANAVRPPMIPVKTLTKSSSAIDVKLQTVCQT